MQQIGEAEILFPYKVDSSFPQYRSNGRYQNGEGRFVKTRFFKVELAGLLGPEPGTKGF